MGGYMADIDGGQDMLTLRKLTGKQMDDLALRLMDKTKARIMEGKPHEGIHAVNVKRFIPFYVQYNQGHNRHGG
jgi:hypothetical protein